jgi:purine-binding chemotaxis protein CheW
MNQQNINHNVIEILESRAKALAKMDIEENQIESNVHLITFLLDGERYAVPIDEVIEIQPLNKWAKIPCTPDFIRGAVNLRGRIYPMLDIARFFGLADRPMMKSTHVLLVRGDNPHNKNVIELVLLADERPVEMKIDRADIDTISSTLSSQAQEYNFGVTSQMIIVLDLKRLLASAEIIVSEEV